MLAYSFETATSIPSDQVTSLLGGKGAGLVAMTAAGLPVPPGFTLTTAACHRYQAGGWDAAFDQEVLARIDELEAATGKRLGSTEQPLLVSVRSGAAISMPGMMDTVLNVGMNDAVETALASATGSPSFAADTHRRFLLYYAQIVLGADESVVATAASATTAAEVKDVLAAAGHLVPDDPRTQVVSAVRAVFDSWNGERARHYRRIEDIADDLGTAATIQSMVFGNLGADSGTGVAFTRDPSTGDAGLNGDFLVNAQGEDVVAGDHATADLSELAATWPEQWTQLQGLAATLEQHYRDMVDIEFTIEQGRLWLLQARAGKRSPLAAFRAAVDMADDPGFPLDRAEAVERCRAHLDDPPQAVAAAGGDGLTVVATGIAACPGIASGVLCVDVDEAVRLGEQGIKLVLARSQTSPADVAGMAAAAGIFTTLGGTVSHAAVVARSWGTAAVVGATDAVVDENGVTGPGGRVAPGEVVTVDGAEGVLLAGAVDVAGVPVPEVLTVSRWATELEAGGTGPATDSASPDHKASGDLTFGLVHALRIKGMGTVDVLAAMTAADPEAVTAALGRLEQEGLVKFMEPRALWLITPDGRTVHQQLLDDRLDGLSLDGLPYQPFLDLNGRFKELCTDWQLRNGEPNDHEDVAYDEGIRQRLAVLHDEATPVLAGQAAILDWLAPYQPRLTAALVRLQQGDVKALTGVMCDSYHDIWMELHEDLIVTQGIDRVAEGSG